MIEMPDSSRESAPGQTPSETAPTASGQGGVGRLRSPSSQHMNTLPRGSAGQAGAGVPQTLGPPIGGPRGTGRGTCNRGPAGQRVLAGRHLDTCPGDCDGCAPCLDPHCRTCRRHHAVLTCPSCLALARLNLATLQALVTALPSQAVHGRQAYHQHDGIPGGDATVMLTPASPGWPPGWTGPVTTELPTDPRPPLDVLTHWTNVWRGLSNQPTDLTTTMDRACDYLAAQLHLLAAHPLFPNLAKDLARVLHSVESVLHAGQRPDLSRVPCWDCGTRLTKVWATEEDHDHWRCGTCGEVYDQGRYELAKHDHLHSSGADRFVPLTDAVAVTGRSEDTIRGWVLQELVESRRLPGGRREVWWPDVRDRHRVTPIRRRARP